ncbi:MAG: TolC family protein [Planctomycetes bacterium]|nr:TolC family protein [Planctomycetota bacterium]
MTLPTTQRCVIVSLGAAVALAGCASPFEPMTGMQLRQAAVDSVRRELEQAMSLPQTRRTVREDFSSQLGIDAQFMPELQEMVGAGQAVMDFDGGLDLFGRPQQTVEITLERVVKTTVAQNLELEFARFAPAVAAAQIVQAEAAFDWTLFSTLDLRKGDRPATSPTIGNRAVGLGTDVRDSVNWTTGIRRQFVSGGQLSIQHELIFTDTKTPGLATTPDPAKEIGVVLQYDQPLLRGFGSDVMLSQVRLQRNAERDEIAALEASLINAVTTAERGYWQLVLAHRDLQIAQRNLDRGVEIRDKVKVRVDLGLDATQAELAEANARVQTREGAVLNARRNFKLASDQLKSDMNDPELTLGSGILLVPADQPLDVPIELSLFDLLLTAMDRRPEMRQAVLSIDNTSIRLQVAKNGLLPQLNMRLQTRFSGLEDDYSSAYSDAYDGQFIDYLLGLNFEYPLGNRQAEAQVRQRTLERLQATIAYRNTVKQIVLDVIRSLRNVITDYQLIAQAKTTKLAAAESLRTLNVQLKETLTLDVNNLNLALQRQDSLAQAERAEIQAMADYNNSIANLYAAIGTALERNQIEFVVPDVLPAGGRVRGGARPRR